MIQLKRATFQLIFAAVILMDFLAAGIRIKLGEPYPALMMPSFSGTMVDRDGNIRLTNVKCKVAFKDGQVEWLTPDQLLFEAPDSNRMPIMSHMFGPPPTVASKWPPDTLKGKLLPGRAWARAHETQSELDPQTKQWLQRRIVSIYPQHEPATAIFIWYETVFSAHPGSPAKVLEPYGTREVHF